MAEIVNEVRLGASSILENLKISSADILDTLRGRSYCPKCGKSRKYFCYTCYIAMDEIADAVPHIKLPIKIDIIKHPKEVDGKSTATHAAVLAPDDVSIYTYPYIPAYEHKEKLLMIFPGKNSITLEQLMNKLNLEIVSVVSNGGNSCMSTQNCCSVCDQASQSDSQLHGNCSDIFNDFSKLCTTNDKSEGGVNAWISTELHNHPTYSLKEAGSSQEMPNHSTRHTRPDVNKRILKSRFPFERVILIDSTWNQVRGIRQDERLQGILKLELTERESCFWRFQRGKPRTYLSTIEAIYYFLVDVHATFINSKYEGEYDNLLFFFKYMFKKIHSLYDPLKLRAYQQNILQAP